jgi:hypothetical protein
MCKRGTDPKILLSGDNCFNATVTAARIGYTPVNDDSNIEYELNIIKRR